MSAIRVVVVDDSVVIRRVLADILDGDPDIEVVATASNGRIGLERIAQHSPDLVTMDIEMPVMDGVEAVKELRRTDRRTPVIMFSTLTERGATATLDALAAGANDYVTKPASTGSAIAAMDRVRTDLLPRIKALVGRGAAVRRALPSTPTNAPAPSIVTRPRTVGGQPPQVVAIGTSTGGPNALETLLTSLQPRFPVPIVVVQHMPPLFSRLLAERLDGKTDLQVREAEPGMRLAPGQVVIAPGDYHMVVRQTLAGVVEIQTNQAPPENSCRPAVDVLFRSVAATYGNRALGLMLTGMGHDGLAGSRDLVAAGGELIAQDEASSVVWGMPGAVARDGLATEVLPLDLIAGTLDRRVRRLGAAAPGSSTRPAGTSLRAGTLR